MASRPIILLLATHTSPGKRATSCQGGGGVWYGLRPLNSFCRLSCLVPLARLMAAQALPPKGCVGTGQQGQEARAASGE